MSKFEDICKKYNSSIIASHYENGKVVTRALDIRETIDFCGATSSIHRKDRPLETVKDLMFEIDLRILKIRQDHCE